VLKQRLIAFLPVKGGIVVQSIDFERYLPVGKPQIAVEALNQWGIDEIILADIEATPFGRCIDREMVRDVSKVCFVPLTVGGGIRSVAEMTDLIHSGADKIAINTAAVRTPELVTQGAETFGSQCIVVSMDVRRNQNGQFEVFIHSGCEATGVHPMELARRAERLGAGEVFLTSIDRDGSKIGYDLELAHAVAQSVRIPVIVCGGAGHPKHFYDGLKLPNVSAVAAGNYFHFSEHSATVTKSYLRKACPQNVRLDTYVDYREFSYDDRGRIDRQTDEHLEKLFFEFHPREVI